MSDILFDSSIVKEPTVRVFTPPMYIDLTNKNWNTKSVFLGGTIDNGNSANWQKGFIRKAQQYGFNIEGGFAQKPMDIYNPRRDKWNSKMKNSFDNPHLFQQISWEMDAMEKADFIIINFLPDSESPISLLELGLYARTGKLRVICPDEFYRSGNVHFICNKFKIPLFKSMEDFDLNY